MMKSDESREVFVLRVEDAAIELLFMWSRTEGQTDDVKRL